MSEYEKLIEDEARKHLVGKKIDRVFYVDQEQADEAGWFARGIVIVLEDGTELVPLSDDEGNGPGAVATSLDGLLSLIGVIR